MSLVLPFFKMFSFNGFIVKGLLLILLCGFFEWLAGYSKGLRCYLKV